MAEPTHPDVIVHICTSCSPQGGHLPRQWKQGGLHVAVREVPCSGKMDLQYLLNAIEGGGAGLCVVTCPKGTCRLGQGNYRAEVRFGTMRRLLREIGIEPQRVELLQYAATDPFEPFEQAVRASVERICALGKSPIAVAAARASSAARKMAQAPERGAPSPTRITTAIPVDDGASSLFRPCPSELSPSSRKP